MSDDLQKRYDDLVKYSEAWRRRADENMDLLAAEKLRTQRLARENTNLSSSLTEAREALRGLADWGGTSSGDPCFCALGRPYSPDGDVVHDERCEAARALLDVPLSPNSSIGDARGLADLPGQVATSSPGVSPFAPYGPCKRCNGTPAMCAHNPCPYYPGTEGGSA